jgi:hypothetical protein
MQEDRDVTTALAAVEVQMHDHQRDLSLRHQALEAKLDRNHGLWGSDFDELRDLREAVAAFERFTQ